MPDGDFNRVFSILERNEDKDFVRRILYPETADAIVNEDGSYSTHRMATAEADGTHYVYPTIISDEYGTLQQHNGGEAFKAAIRSGEAIGFGTAKEAEWFERHWKLMWDRNYKADR